MAGPDVVASEPLLKVGLIGPLPPPSGGMANQTRQLARLLAEAGVSVELVQVNAPYRPEWMGKVWGLRALFRLLPYLAHLWRCAGRVDLFHVMANSGWAWHLFAAPAVWLAALRGKPAIINYRGGEADSFFATQFHWVKPTLARATAIIVPSGFLEAVFAKRGVKTETVPNIIDLSRFRPAEARSAQCHLIVTRNLEDIYDIPTALRAFALILKDQPHARLTVAGSGPRLAGLEALCDELQIAEAVRFTGRLDNEHMADLYRDADLLLNPSLADNMPISLLEAMASGVPIVSTDVGGIPYLVEHGVSAMLVPPEQPEAMAASALRVLDDPALAARLRDAGLARARRYTWPLVSERLFAMYVKVLGRQIKPAGGPRPGRLPCE
jgi:glycosyltransferase involved in cell wall biosynthesis